MRNTHWDAHDREDIVKLLIEKGAYFNLTDVVSQCHLGCNKTNYACLPVCLPACLLACLPACLVSHDSTHTWSIESDA
jgi:hypothetical protein